MGMSRRERFLAALYLEQPDVLPVTDLGMDPPIVEKIVGRPMDGFSFVSLSSTRGWEASRRNAVATVEAYEKLGLDAISISHLSLTQKRFTAKRLDANTFVDEWGRVMQSRADTKTTWWRGGIIKTREDLEDFEPPSPEAPGRAEIFEAAKKASGDDAAVMAVGNTGFSLSWEARGGIPDLIRDMYTNPNFAKALMSKVADACLEMSKMMIDGGIDLLVASDDYGDSHGPLIHPRLLREFEMPNLKRLCDLAKRRGIPVLKHTDGNVAPIIDDMVDAGISGLHPIEPGPMEIRDIKERYGDKIFIGGNVDCRYVLPFGDEADVRRDVRRAVDAASSGGGHILASSNTFHSNVKVENIYVMTDEARRYGRYPL